MTSSAASMPFIRNLASSDRRTRTQSLEALKAFLAAKYAGAAAAAGTTLSFGDAHKLWAGLFYALWMADRAPVQQRLCDELAGLPAAVGLSEASTAAWLRAFWATMARQWTTGIDVLRMDKFLLLVRRVLAAQLSWMAGAQDKGKDGKDDQADKQDKKSKKSKKSKKGETTPAATGLAVLQEWPLNPEAEAVVDEGVAANEIDHADGGRRRKRVATTLRIPVGLTMHVVDIWVDEAARLGWLEGTADNDDNEGHEDENASKGQALLRGVNGLVESLAAETRAAAVRKHAREALMDERLPWVEKATDPEDEEDEEDEGEEGEQKDMDKDSWNGFD